MYFDVTVNMRMRGTRDSYKKNPGDPTPTDEQIIESIKDDLRHGEQPISTMRKENLMVRVEVLNGEDSPEDAAPGGGNEGEGGGE